MRETAILATALAVLALGQPAAVAIAQTGADGGPGQAAGAAPTPAPLPPAAPATTPPPEAVAGEAGGDRYRSYAAVASAGFRGSVAGGYSVEQLMGKDVVGPDGDEIAEVADLLVEADDRVRKVIVDVGGFLGIGAKPVVLDIAQLSRRGDSQDLHTSMTREQLEALPSYERGADGYYVRGKGN